MSIEERRKAFLDCTRSQVINAQLKTSLVSCTIFLALYVSKSSTLIGLCLVVLWYILFRRIFPKYDFFWVFPPSWPITKKITGIRSSTFLLVPAIPAAMSSVLPESAHQAAVFALLFAITCYMFKSIVMEYRSENS